MLVASYKHWYVVFSFNQFKIFSNLHFCIFLDQGYWKVYFLVSSFLGISWISCYYRFWIEFNSIVTSRHTLYDLNCFQRILKGGRGIKACFYAVVIISKRGKIGEGEKGNNSRTKFMGRWVQMGSGVQMGVLPGKQAPLVTGGRTACWVALLGALYFLLERREFWGHWQEGSLWETWGKSNHLAEWESECIMAALTSRTWGLLVICSDKCQENRISFPQFLQHL